MYPHTAPSLKVAISWTLFLLQSHLQFAGFFFFFPIAKSPGKAVGNNSRPDLHSKFSLIYFQVGATRTLRVGHFLSFLFVCLFDAHVKGRRRKRECSFKVHFKYCRSKNFSKYCLHENRMNVHKDKISHRRPIQSR